MTQEESGFQGATDYLVLNVPTSVRTRADELLRQANGHKQRALELALEREDRAADSHYILAVKVRSLCQSRAQADFEGSYVLVEVIEESERKFQALEQGMTQETEPAITDDELMRAFHSGEGCPECGDTMCVFSEDTQDVEDCPSCERVMALLPDKGLSGEDVPSNVVRVSVDPVTKKIDAIPF